MFQVASLFKDNDIIDVHCVQERVVDTDCREIVTMQSTKRTTICQNVEDNVVDVSLAEKSEPENNLLTTGESIEVKYQYEQYDAKENISSRRCKRKRSQTQSQTMNLFSASYSEAIPNNETSVSRSHFEPNNTEMEQQNVVINNSAQLTKIENMQKHIRFESSDCSVKAVPTTVIKEYRSQNFGLHDISQSQKSYSCSIPSWIVRRTEEFKPSNTENYLSPPKSN